MSASNTPPPITTRAQLYERIRQTSRDEVILTEMQRMGFWPADDKSHTVAAELIRREAELSKSLQELGRELNRVEDPVKALKYMRKQRMAKARERREETRKRRAAERHERALAWHRRHATELLYLGEGVSSGLAAVHSDADKLARLALPPMSTAQDLAAAMGLTLQELRFLAFERRVSRISHYRRFAMPKKTGGHRIISAPMPRLKRAQYWVLDNVLARSPAHPAAHGFLKGRSIVSNAAPHVGKAVVINLDLKNFFPSVGVQRIKGVFKELGYSAQVATTLALLCTEAPTEEVSVDGEQFFVAHGLRALPQGAPTSPALTNILCRRMDARLQGAAAKLGFAYTRYADDLTFSGGEEARKLAGKLLWRVKQIVVDEGFTPHPEKQQVMRSAQRQSVTGIVVNEKPSLERDTLRRFRATLYQVEKDGPAGKQWNGNTNVIDALEGYAQFIKMVDAEKGAPLLARVRAARARWVNGETPAHAVPQPRSGGSFRALSAQGNAPWEGFWQAGPPPAPALEKTAEQVKTEKKEAKAEAAGKQKPKLDKKARQDEQQAFVAASQPRRRRPWDAVAIQLFLGMTFSLGSANTLPFAASLVLAWLALRDFRSHWVRFAIAMIVVQAILAAR